MANTYRDLIAWQKAFSLCSDVYRAIRHFPKAEVYGFAAQMQWAAVSIPSNIAEGFGRRTSAFLIRPFSGALEHWWTSALSL
jgi:four helix bundle protein